MITMNTEQERAEFEAECKFKMIPTDRNSSGEYTDLFAFAGWRFWQAGRAALQSQDREDAARYRALVACGHFVPAPRPYFSVWGLRTTEGKATKKELDEAIDHARRIEGAEQS